MPDGTKFSKKIFALLLEKGKGERSWRQYAFDADISYVQMRKLAQCEQENPPRPKLIHKLAACSVNGITLNDFMFAIGTYSKNPDARLTDGAVSPSASKHSAFIRNYHSLAPKHQRLVEDFCEFLAARTASSD